MATVGDDLALTVSFLSNRTSLHAMGVYARDVWADDARRWATSVAHAKLRGLLIHNDDSFSLPAAAREHVALERISDRSMAELSRLVQAGKQSGNTVRYIALADALRRRAAAGDGPVYVVATDLDVALHARPASWRRRAANLLSRFNVTLAEDFPYLEDVPGPAGPANETIFDFMRGEDRRRGEPALYVATDYPRPNWSWLNRTIRHCYGRLLPSSARPGGLLNNAIVGGHMSLFLPFLDAFIERLMAAHAPVCDVAALNLMHLDEGGRWSSALAHYGEVMNPLTCGHFPTQPRARWFSVGGRPPPCFTTHKRR